MKKLIITLVLICLFLPLYATPWSVSLGTGYRASVSTEYLRFVDAEVSVGDFSLYFRDHSFQVQDLSLSYDLRVGKTIHNEFVFHSEYVPIDKGGFSDFSYMFSQRFKISFFSIGYGVGAQVGLSYSAYSKELLWALSPLFRLETGFTFGPITFGIYGDLGSKFERLWKASPLIGAVLIAQMDEHNSITFDIYTQSAEYLLDPWFLPAVVAACISYTYRGTL